MISYCVVSLKSTDQFLETLIDSLFERSKKISEVIIAQADADKPFSEEWKENNISFKRFRKSFFEKKPQQSVEHAINMHDCFDMVSNDYLFIGNPDIFFYSDVDQFFLDLMHKYELNYIGLSHNSAVNHAHQFFPTVYLSLVKKIELPDAKFLEGKLKFTGEFNYPLGDEESFQKTKSLDGKWLIPGPIPEYVDKFSKKTGLYDTGCNLWLWALEKNWKWLAFQTSDCHTYDTKYFRSNFKMNDKLPRKKLAYHSVGSSRGLDSEIEKFKSEYKESFEEQ